MTGSYVARALRSAFPFSLPLAERLVMAMQIDGYFDESGTHHGSEGIVAAGYLAGPQRWEQFEGKWNEALADFGVESFHMADFVARQPPFDTEDWRGRSGEARFRRLAQIVNEAAEWGVGIAVPRAGLDAFVGPDLRKQSTYAYALATVFCTLDVGLILRANYPDGRLALFFDAGAPGEGLAEGRLRRALKSPVGQAAVPLDSIDFVDRHRFVPLQAADILVHSLYRRFCQRRTYMDILEAPLYWSVLDEDEVAACSTLFNLWSISYGKPARPRKRPPPPPLPERLRPHGVIIDYRSFKQEN